VSSIYDEQGFELNSTSYILKSRPTQFNVLCRSIVNLYTSMDAFFVTNDTDKQDKVAIMGLEIMWLRSDYLCFEKPTAQNLKSRTGETFHVFNVTLSYLLGSYPTERK